MERIRIIGADGFEIGYDEFDLSLAGGSRPDGAWESVLDGHACTLDRAIYVAAVEERTLALANAFGLSPQDVQDALAEGSGRPVSAPTEDVDPSADAEVREPEREGPRGRQFVAAVKAMRAAHPFPGAAPAALKARDEHSARYLRAYLAHAIERLLHHKAPALIRLPTPHDSPGKRVALLDKAVGKMYAALADVDALGDMAPYKQHHTAVAGSHPEGPAALQAARRRADHYLEAAKQRANVIRTAKGAGAIDPNAKEIDLAFDPAEPRDETGAWTDGGASYTPAIAAERSIAEAEGLRAAFTGTVISY